MIQLIITLEVICILSLLFGYLYPAGIRRKAKTKLSDEADDILTISYKSQL